MLKTDMDKIGRFSQADFEVLSRHMVKRLVKKNQLLLDQGQICQSVYFISSGAAYQFWYDDIEEKVADLHMEGEWCLAYSSLVSQVPSKNIIKVNVESHVYELGIHAIHHLIKVSPVFLQLGKILEGALSRSHYLVHSMSPSEKYNHLIHARPHVLQVFPLKIIASYLSMTPETLSRIRASF